MQKITPHLWFDNQDVTADIQVKIKQTIASQDVTHVIYEVVRA